MSLRRVINESNGESIQNMSHISGLMNKWGKFLKGVEHPRTKQVMAQLFENQANHLLAEETTTDNAGSYLKYTFPLLRRVWPSLIANDVVSVQPMTAPVGGVFYFDLKYGTTKGRTVAGGTLIKDFDRWYSSAKIDREVIGSGDGTAVSFTSVLDFVPVRPATAIITAIIGTVAVTATSDEAGIISGTGPTGPITGTIDAVTGAITVVYTVGDEPDAATELVAEYRYNMEGNSQMPQVNIDIELLEIKAETRKIKAQWTAEAADDLKALHGIDGESEIVAAVASNIALELDREIVEDLYKGSTVYPATFNISTPPTATPEIFHIRNLITFMSRCSNSIHRQTQRGPANWAITSPAISAYLEQLEMHGDFRPVFAGADGEKIEQPHAYGTYKLGTLSSKWMLFKDTFFPVNNEGSGSGVGDILMGYKGNSFIDAGYVYAPYVPLQITSTFLNPDNLKNIKAFRTRYATKMLRSEFYQRVRVTGL